MPSPVEHIEYAGLFSRQISEQYIRDQMRATILRIRSEQGEQPLTCAASRPAIPPPPPPPSGPTIWQVLDETEPS